MAGETAEFVLLPPQGLRATGAANAEARAFLQSADQATGAQAMSFDGRDVPLRVIDSIGPDGAKLVELSPESALAVRASRPDLRLVPVVHYTPAVAEPETVEEPVVAAGRRAAAASTITLQVVSKKGGGPVANAFVVAFVDYKARNGAQGVTDDNGEVSLAAPPGRRSSCTTGAGRPHSRTARRRPDHHSMTLGRHPRLEPGARSCAERRASREAHPWALEALPILSDQGSEEHAAIAQLRLATQCSSSAVPYRPRDLPAHLPAGLPPLGRWGRRGDQSIDSAGPSMARSTVRVGWNSTGRLRTTRS